MEIIGSEVESKITNIKGTITAIEKKFLTVSFLYGGMIKTPLNKYDELFNMSDELKAAIEEYIQSLKVKK